MIPSWIEWSNCATIQSRVSALSPDSLIADCR
jgi:hypothetical protein